jgi:hypothetical protein
MLLLHRSVAVVFSTYVENGVITRSSCIAVRERGLIRTPACWHYLPRLTCMPAQIHVNTLREDAVCR